MTTKILALTDALGNLVRFILLPGQRFDTVGVPPLIEGLSFGALIADKAFDSNTIITDLNERGAKIVISQHPRRALPPPLDEEMYKWRHLIENFFCKPKEFKRIAVRGAKVRARSSLLNSGWDGELASDSSDSISHSQHHPLCECVPGLLPLLLGLPPR
jgi:transposase